MSKLRHYSNFLSVQVIRQMDSVILDQANKLCDSLISFNIDDLLGESEFTDAPEFSITSAGVFLELEEFSTEEEKELIAERLEIMVKRNKLVRADNPKHYYVNKEI